MGHIDATSEVHGPRTVILSTVCLKRAINDIEPRQCLRETSGHALHSSNTNKSATSLQNGCQPHAFSR